MDRIIQLTLIMKPGDCKIYVSEEYVNVREKRKIYLANRKWETGDVGYDEQFRKNDLNTVKVGYKLSLSAYILDTPENSQAIKQKFVERIIAMQEECKSELQAYKTALEKLGHDT